MLYLAIPAHDEAATIGVLLWRLRTVLAEFPREYEAVVYDDASTDSTPEILESYARVMPLTVLRGERKVGYAGAVDALIRHVARHTRYPRRDAVLLLQGDFTDSPSLVPEFVKRFEGGTDVVVGERDTAARRKAPAALRGLMRAEPWLTRFLVRAEGIRDITSSYRLIRISVLRDLLRTVGDSPVCAGDTRTANADLLLRLVPLARRVEGIPVEPTWQLRQRETRIMPVSDAISLLKWAWSARGRKVAPSTAPESAIDSSRPARNREGRPELRLEGRADGAAEVSVLSSESVRSSGGRTSGTRTSTQREPAAGRVRPPRAARGEPKSSKTADSGSAPTGSAPTGSAPTGSAPTGSAPTGSAPTGTDATGGGALGADAPNERPPRRKRSRSRRSAAVEGSAVEGSAVEGGTVEGSAVEGTSADGTTPTVSTTAVSGASTPTADVASPPSDSPYSDVVDVPPARPALSASVTEAIENAEEELDIGTHQRSLRKKRRRRGSRGGRVNGAGDDETAGPAERSETSESPDESEAPDGESSGAIRKRNRPARDVGADEADEAPGAGRSGDDDGDQDGVSGEEGEAADGRPRRRGRRGRRGGARRKRSGGDSTDSSAAGNEPGVDLSAWPDSSPPPAPPRDDD